jgi:hypothetical protein
MFLSGITDNRVPPAAFCHLVARAAQPTPLAPVGLEVSFQLSPQFTLEQPPSSWPASSASKLISS